MPKPQGEVEPFKEKDTRTNLIDQQYVEYTPYQAYLNHPFQLIQSELVIPIPIEPLKPLYPLWYDENAHCKFHLGVQGHSIEYREAFKYQVQALMERGYLNFEKKSEEGLCQVESIPITYTDLFPHLIAN